MTKEEISMLDIKNLISVINKITENLSFPVREDNLKLIHSAFSNVGYVQEKALWVFEVTDMVCTYIILRANMLHFTSEEICDEHMDLNDFKKGFF